MKGKSLIRSERNRQLEIEGWTLGDDDNHGADVLESAAISYRDAQGSDSPIPKEWPWASDWWKPKTRQRNLERAGALYLAAAQTAERAGSYEERDRLNDQVESCALLLDSLTEYVG